MPRKVELELGAREWWLLPAAANLLAERDIYLEEQDSDLDSDFIISKAGSGDLLVRPGE